MMNVKYDKMAEKNFDASFDDLVPTVMLSYMMSPTQMLNASYNTRIRRPGIRFLNPFKDTSNPNSISYGNPDLDTEKSHTLGLGFSSFSTKFSVNANLNYSFVNNGIQRYSFVNQGAMESTYGNIGRIQRTSLSLWMNWNPGNTTRISFNANGMYTDLRCNESFLKQSNNGYYGYVFLDVQQSLPWEVMLSLYGGISSPYISLQEEGSTYNYYGFSLSRSFLKDKRLNISINTSNLFYKYAKLKNSTVTDSFRSWNENKSQHETYGLNISWQFGKLNARVKQTNRTIVNDDLLSSEEGNK